MRKPCSICSPRCFVPFTPRETHLDSVTLERGLFSGASGSPSTFAAGLVYSRDPQTKVNLMKRIFNFGPGPATLPVPVLEEASRGVLEIGGSGMSILEVSHRGKEYEAIHFEAR